MPRIASLLQPLQYAELESEKTHVQNLVGNHSQPLSELLGLPLQPLSTCLCIPANIGRDALTHQICSFLFSSASTNRKSLASRENLCNPFVISLTFFFTPNRFIRPREPAESPPPIFGAETCPLPRTTISVLSEAIPVRVKPPRQDLDQRQFTTGRSKAPLHVAATSRERVVAHGAKPVAAVRPLIREL